MNEELRCSIDSFFASAVRDSIPLSVEFELTYRCSLHCSHCYVVDRGEKELSFSEVTNILDHLAAENCLFLTLTGGEVMLRKDFLDIARYARTKGFALKVFSNGTLIDENITREMATLQPLEVGISIYGADAATHDRFTGVPGSFDRSLRALNLLKAYGVFSIVKCLLMKENVAQIEGVKTLAREVGSIVQFDPVVTPRNDGNRDPLQHELSDSDLEHLFSHEAATTRQTDGEARPLAESVICRAGWDTCCISPGGEVYPCVALPMPLGNLRRQSFGEVWRGEAAVKLRAFKFTNLRQCAVCPDLDYCARCWGLAAIESGDHLGPSHLNCRIARIRHRISSERKQNL